MGNKSSGLKYDLFRYKVALTILGPEQTARLEHYFDSVSNNSMLELSVFLGITAGSIVPAQFVKNCFYMFRNNYFSKGMRKRDFIKMIAALTASELSHRCMFYFAFISSINNPNQQNMFIDEMEFYIDDLHKYLSMMGFSKETIKGLVGHLNVTQTVPINYNMWMRVFERIQEHPAFNWPKYLFKREDDKHSRYSKTPQKSSIFEKENLDKFSEEQIQNLRVVYQRIKTMEIGKSQYNGLIQVIGNYSKPIAESVKYFSKKKLLLFSTFCEIINALTGRLDDVDRSRFIFGLYAKHKKSLKQKRWELMDRNFDFPQIFKGTQQLLVDEIEMHFKNTLSDPKVLLEEEFCGIVMKVFFSWRAHFKPLRYLLYTDLKMQPITVNTEFEAIHEMLHQKEPDEFLNENIDKYEAFVLIPKRFWDHWSSAGKSHKTITRIYNSYKSHRVKAFSLKKSLNGCALKSKLRYGADYYLIPEQPWLMIKSWYYNPETLKRPVLKHDIDPGRNKVIHKAGVYYEIEIDAPVLKYDKILEDGTFPSKSGKKKDFHFHSRYAGREKFMSSGIGPLEIVVSRTETLLKLKETLANCVDAEPQLSRLWINKEKLTEDLETQTIQECAQRLDLSSTVFYIEERQRAGSWPSQNLKRLQSQEHPHQDGTSKTRGLINLGNTCYMNSALQCIFNTPCVQQYLLGEDINFSKQINRDNKLGYQGFLVKAFARLLDHVVASNSGVAPRQFKKIVSACNQQFYGFQQQDAQEFLVFLIDGLHEEVNLRQRPAYIENPQSEGRDLLDLSLQFYSNHLRRNWSFFSFLFHGQFKNEITCTECSKKSHTFEPFNHLSLPIEDKAMCKVKVELFKLPQQIRNILSGRVNPQQLEEVGDDENESLITQLIESVRGPAPDLFSKEQLHSVRNPEQFRSVSHSRIHRHHHQNHNDLDDPSPIELNFIVPRQSMGIDILKEIEKIEDLDLQSAKQRPAHFKSSSYSDSVYSQPPAYEGANNTARYKTMTQLIMYVAVGYNRTVVLGNLNSLTQLLNVDEITLFTYEVITPIGKEFILKWYHQNQTFLKNVPDAPYRLPQRFKMGMSGSKRKQPSQPRQELSKRGSLIHGESSHSADQPEKQPITYTSYFNEYSRYQMPHAQQEVQFSNWIIVIAHNRTYQTIQDEVFASRIDFKLESVPLFFLVSKEITGYQLYEEVYARIQGRLKPESKYRKRENLWWTGEFRNSTQAKNSHFTSVQKQLQQEEEDKLEQSGNLSSSESEQEVRKVEEEHLLGPKSPGARNMDTPRMEEEEDEQGSPDNDEKRSIAQKVSDSNQIAKKQEQVSKTPEIQKAQQQKDEPIQQGLLVSNAKKIENEILKHKPFLLRLYNYERTCCGVCRKVSCRGCVVNPDFNVGQFQIQHTFNMFIDWSANIFTNHLIQFGVCSHPSNKESNTKQQEKEQKHVSDLSDCFKRLTQKEVIEGKDAVYCSTCKNHTKHQKILSLFRLPPVLVLQFKRFRFISHRSKISTVINFPLYGLHMQDFMDPQILRANDDNSAEDVLNNHHEDYDLYAVINHYGNLNSGHYTACISDSDGNWSYYDDSEVRAMPDSEEVRSQFAYMLFYKRRGIQAKKLREEIFPSLSSIFVGKPVNFKGKRGFIKDKNLNSRNFTTAQLKTQPLLQSIPDQDQGSRQQTLDLENNSPALSKIGKTGGGMDTPSKNITIRINESGLKGTDVLSLNEDIEMEMLDQEKDVDFINESEEDVFKKSSKEEEAKLKEFLLECEQKMQDRKIKPHNSSVGKKSWCSSLCYFKGLKPTPSTGSYENKFN